MQETLQPIIVALVIANFYINWYERNPSTYHSCSCYYLLSLLIDMQETLQPIIVALVITNFLY